MRIEFAADSDYSFILERDGHISQPLIASKIREREILLLREGGNTVGWMRFGYFWDNIPFMNMLWIDEAYRGRGYGKEAVLYWEELLKEKGFKTVMTSTLSNEGAQHFYRKLGYRDAGCLLLEGEPLEILLTKRMIQQGAIPSE